MKRTTGVALIVALTLPVTAAANGGSLSQLAAPHDCLLEGAATEGCVATGAVGIQGPTSIAVSPDGKNVYVAAFDSNSVAEFARAADGSLTQLSGANACIGWNGGGASECSTTVAGLDQPSVVRVSPDGTNVYVLGRQSDSVAEFARDSTTGALTFLGAVTGPGVSHPDGIVITADGANAYVASSRNPGFVAEFARNPDGTLTQLAAPNNCIEGVNDPNPPQCGTVDAPGLNGATAIVESTGGGSDNVYVASVDLLGTIAEFTRNPNGSLAQLSGANACIGETGSSTCGANVSSGLTFVDALDASSDGRNVYTAANDDRGTVGEFARASNGALSALTCIEGSVAFSSQPAQCTTVGTGLGAAFGIALTPDGGNAYVASASGGALVELARNQDGSFSQLAPPDDCIGRSPCGSSGHGLVEPLAVAVSPDGANVYAATYPGGLTGAVTSFLRNVTPAPPTAYVVDTTADTADAHPGDGACADATGRCSLRAAVQETNASCGQLPITVPAGTYTLTAGPLVVRCTTLIQGAGARTTTITRSGAHFRIFEIASGTVAIQGFTITGGLASGDVEDNPGVGGGIWIDNPAHVALIESTVSNNQASVSGGGIDSDGALTVLQSTISGNSVPGTRFGIGGGIDDFGSSLQIVNSTIAENSAGTSGGGIFTATDTTLVNDTIARNTGGGYHREGLGNSQTFVNTIVAANSPSDCDVTLPTSLGHNHSSDASCGFTASGDLENTDAQLGALTNNGGPTDTILPPPGSSAIDGGFAATCPSTDQRGVTRPQGPQCDIGAVELAGSGGGGGGGGADATASTVSAAPASVPADDSTLTTITVTLKDSAGNLLSGKTVTLSQGTGRSSISGVGTTGADGVATFHADDNYPETVTYTAHDTTDGVDLAQTATVTFTALGGGGGPSVPTLASITPSTGPAAGGTTVTIDGSGFTGATAVHFGAAAGTSVHVTGDTELTVTSPAGTGTVDVTVTGPGGTSAAVTADHFTFVAPPEPSHPVVRIDGLTQIPSGQTAPEQVVLYDTGGPLTGALTLSVAVPAGLARVSQVANGWSCPTVTEGLVVCTSRTTVEPKHVVPALTISLSTAGLQTGTKESLAATLTAGTFTALTSLDVTVLPSTKPALEVGVRQATSVVDTQGGAAVVDVTNVGRSATASGLTVTLPPLAGASVTKASGTGWGCTGPPSSTTWTCTQSGVAERGQRLPALDLRLASTDDATAQALLSATATDPASGVTSTGKGSIGLLHTTVPVLGLVSTLPLDTRVGPSGNLQYQLSVTNTGTAAEGGDLELSYSYPAGSTVVASPTRASGWSCTVTAHTGQPVSLTCVRPQASGRSLAPGATSSPVPVSVHLPSQLGQGTLVLSGHASSGLVSIASSAHALAGITLAAFPTVSAQHSQSVSVIPPKPISIIAGRPADAISVDTTLGPPASSPAVPLQRGEAGFLALHVTNDSGGDQPTGATIGLQLPSSLTLPTAAPAVASKALGTHVNSHPQVLCTAGAPSRGTGTTAYRCQDTADIPAGQGFEIDVPVVVSATAPDNPSVVAGVMASGATLLDVANGLFVGWSQQLPVTVKGIEAVPELAGQPYVNGNPPEVPSVVRTSDAAGKPGWQNNVITLDGSKSTGTGNGSLVYTWAELAGPPAVTPLGAAKPVVHCVTQAGKQLCLATPPPHGVPVPSDATVFYGAQPQVTLPAMPVKTAFVFELWVTDGTRVASATTTVEVDASPEQPPVITAASASSGATQLAQYAPPAAGTAPAPLPAQQPARIAVQAGSCVSLSATAQSPLGYALAWSWQVSMPGDPPTPVSVQPCGQPANGSYGFVWPSGDDMLLVSATVDDGHGGTTTQGLTLGVAPVPLVLSAALPAGFPAGGAAPGTQITLTAASHGGNGTAAGYTWSDCSAQSPGATIVSTSGSSAVVTLPAATGAGQSRTVCVSQAQGGEAAMVATATVDVPLAAPDALAVTAAADASSVGGGGTTGLTATASGGVPPYSYAWSATAGTIAPSGAANATYTAPSGNTADTASVVVTDAAGASATAAVAVTVGSTPAATTGSGCDQGSLLGKAVAALASNAPQGVSVSTGWGTADLGTLSGSIDCSSGYTGAISFQDASFSIGPGLLTGTALTGKITATVGSGSTPVVRVCLTGGSVSLPASWQLPAASVSAAQPLCLDGDAAPTAPGGFASGALTFPGAPFLPLHANGGNTPQTTLTFAGSTIGLTVTGALLGGTATLTGCYAAASGGCTQVVAQGLPAGTTAFSATLAGATVLGVPLAKANGTLTIPAAGAPTYDLSFAVGTATVVPGVTLQSGTLALDNNGLRVHAQGAVGTASSSVAVSVDGTYTDASHWALTVSGNQSASTSCTTWTGTSVDLSCLQFLGTIANTGNGPTVSLRASLSSWQVSSALTVSNLTVQLANDTAPASCTPPATGSNTHPASVVGANDLYLGVNGSGTLTLPGLSAMPIAAAACVDLQTANFLVDASVADWQPVASVDVTLDSADVDLVHRGSGLSFAGSGKATIAGAQLGATLTYDTTSGNVIVDGYGALGTLLPGVSSDAHVVYSTKPRQNYSFYDPGLTTAAGKVNLPGNGLTVALDFALPDPSGPSPGPVGTVLKKLGFSGPTSVVVSAQLSSAGIDLVGSLQTNAEIFGVCHSTGSNVSLTQTPNTSCLSLRLRDLFVELSTNGTIGFGADTLLNLPNASGNPAVLDLRMEMAVQLPAKVTASFQLKGEPTDANPATCASQSGSYTDRAGDWCNALFVPGLDIGSFAIQGSIDFSTAIPTPNIGIYASGVTLPAKLNNLLGIQSDGETMSFGLNISATAPVLDIELGQSDGRAFLQPLQSMGSAAGAAVEVDEADFLFAPFGGQIAGTQFAPGLSLSFDADLFGDSVHVHAHVGLSPTPSVTADVYADTLPLPQFGIVLMKVNLELGFGTGISPPDTSANPQAPCASSIGQAVPKPSPNATFTGFYFAGSGSVGLVPGLPTACLAVALTAGPSGVAIAGGGSLDNWGLGSLISLQHLGFSVSAGPIAVGSSGPGALDNAANNLVPSVSITVNGTAAFLGAHASIAGNLTLGAGGISAANLTLATDSVNYRGLQISADNDPSSTCPTIVTGPGVAAPTATGGPFVQIVYTGGGSSSFQAAFSGAVGFSGVSAAGCGQIGTDGASFSGDLDLNALVHARVQVAGAFYWGTPQPGQLVVTDRPCNGAAQCYDGYLEQQAQQNDWYVAMGASANMTLGGFSINGQFGAGSVGGTTYMHVNAGLSVGTSSTGATVQGAADVSYANGSFNYDFVGAGSVTFNGYQISSVAVSLTPQELALAGRVSLPGTTITVSGTVAVGSGSLNAPCNISVSIPGYTQLASDPNNDVGRVHGGVAFCFYASASFSLFGNNLNAAVVLDNGGFTINGQWDVPLLGGTMSFSGGLYPDGTADGTVSGNLSLFGNSISGTVGACVGNCVADVGENSGVWFDVTASTWVGSLTVKGSYTDPTNFYLSAELDNQGGGIGPLDLGIVEIGGDLSYDISGSVSQNGFSLGDSNLGADLWYATPSISVSWSDGVSISWSDPNYIASVTGTYDASTGNVCLAASVADVFSIPDPNVCI